MELPFLHDLVIVFGLGLVVVLVFTKLRLPPIVGYLATGVIVGPHGLALIRGRHDVELLAEVGVVALLFTIGVELSLGRLLKMGRFLVLGGGLQTLATAGLAVLAGWSFGLGLGESILVGCVVALSSTAIVMRLLTERAETTSPQGRISLGILIFQDLAVVPMILVVPLLAGSEGGWSHFGYTMGKAAAVVVAVLVVARLVVPRFLALVVGTRSRELFLFAILVVCLGTAWLTSEAGLSLGLGAFLAGLMISESEYAHHALGTALPFRDAFSSLFFVSIGMFLDLDFVLAHPLVVGTVTGSVLAGKALVVVIVALALGHHVRIAVLSGILLCQIGEFSFLLLHGGAQAGVLSATTHQLLMAASVLTMAFTPIAIAFGPRISRWISRIAPHPELAQDRPGKRDHVLIVGYGLSGQNVARALQSVRMPYVILELNPATVRRLRAQGEPILYGDATQAEMLRLAGLEEARVLVVTVPDAAATRRIVQLARELNPAIHLIVRTRFVGEVAELFALGATEVVPEEFETSIEIFSRVLRTYLVPREVVEKIVRQTRSEGYEMLRAPHEFYRPVEGLRRFLADVQLEAYGVGETSPLAGKSLAETRLRTETGALVLAVHRNRVTIANPPGDFVLEQGDVALLLGKPESLGKAAGLFWGPG